ncbi:SMC family ATPase [Bacillus sp. ISL-47]|uniref:AAA family ATPase n=1 Tax=Bacillus sp. ISL-47 TaxID=2819130 RepID=UPI001BE57D0D|nr:SMC family ATPase [Bacillus sp. ISL-47]MBT2689882.1 SMC family ATPase [Bacillus sp. ISL-47]MBT2710260.1 SMC family ATPase [Pseudomonas sp. ISL-84]
MRPLKLKMQAFGPYADSEHIDFTELGNRTMFVISGKTGSGKTTIFDGISYAIYGKASGEDRNGPELRSQFAKNETLTEVSLEFTLRNKAYYITRSPQQEKKKERGDGTTTVSAKAELYIYDENGSRQLLASNVRDVDEKIKEIMIIDSNQFRQILMIPQGEFRKLLTSESKEKEVILQRLFHTQIYKRIEEKLKEYASELKRTVEDQVKLRDQLLLQVQAVFNEELKAYLEAGSVNDTILLPLVNAEIVHMSEGLEELTDAGKKQKEKRDNLQQKLYEAETIVKQLKAKEDLKLRKDDLDGLKEQFAGKEKLISLAQKAALLSQQEQLCHEIKKDLDLSNEELTALKKSITSLAGLLAENEERWEAEKKREDERKQAGENVNRLQNMKEDIHSYAEVEKQVRLLEEKLENLRLQKKNKDEAIKNSEHKIQVLAEEKQNIEKCHLKLMENDRRLEKMTEEIERLHKYEEQQGEYLLALEVFEKKKSYFEQATSRLEDARMLVEELERKWLHGQASILANQLQHGEACPVCGSDHHPNPAVSQTDIPDEKDLKAAKRQAAEIEADKAKAESSFYESQSNVKSIENALCELFKLIQKHQPDLEEEQLPVIKCTLLAQRKDLLNIQDDLKKKSTRLEACTLEMEKSHQHKEVLAAEIDSLQSHINDTAILHAEKKGNLTRMTETIPENLRSIEAYQANLKAAVDKLETLQKILEIAQQKYQDTKAAYMAEQAKMETIERQTGKLEEKLTVERQNFVQRMKDQGFEAYGEYRNAKKSEYEIRALEVEVREYREEVRSVSDRYSELLQLLEGVEKPDIVSLQAILKETDDQLKQLQDQYTNLYMKKKHNEETSQKITEINEKMKALEERYKVIGHLYEISKGQNTYRVTFERFVLAAFLDDILREANGRLTRMTSGRYQLLRKTDRSKGNAQSGLELLVFDQYTGQERHVKTLSGGESFKAALALALGLADVVQQYAGGVSLETMFIDEGFGTLDPESLDQAIEALIDIQSSGRLVGIISHVPELKERIDARLEVTASQTGSSTEFQFLN